MDKLNKLNKYFYKIEHNNQNHDIYLQKIKYYIKQETDDYKNLDKINIIINQKGSGFGLGSLVKGIPGLGTALSIDPNCLRHINLVMSKSGMSQMQMLSAMSNPANIANAAKPLINNLTLGEYSMLMKDCHSVVSSMDPTGMSAGIAELLALKLQSESNKMIDLQNRLKYLCNIVDKNNIQEGLNACSIYVKKQVENINKTQKILEQQYQQQSYYPPQQYQ